MKLSKCLGFMLLVVAGCHTAAPSRPTLANLNYLATDKNAIVISCLRCGCIDDELGTIDTALLNKYTIYVDTNCTVKTLTRLPIHHIPQARLDSIAPDLYNMLVLIKEKDGTIKRELITTEASAQMGQVLQQGQ